MYLSIVIPTLNEEAYIVQTINAIRGRISDGAQYEIIVIDSGSTDGTVSKLNEIDVAVEQKGQFKGSKYQSLNFGASIAKGDTLLFVDADCIVPDEFDLSIKYTLESRNTVGGAFEFKAENRSFTYQLIELINRIRYRLDGLYFGDQGVFCKKSSFDKIGGYPDEPLMEAAFLCKKIKKTGKLRLIKNPIITSSRRFEKGGAWTVFFKDTLIWIRFLTGRSVKEYALDYWKKNEHPDFVKKVGSGKI